MTRTYNIIKDERDIKWIFGIICNAWHSGAKFEQALKWLAEKSYIGGEGVALSFQGDLDDYEQSQLPYPLDDKHVLLEFMFAGVGVSDVAYIDFPTLYQYACDQAAYEMEQDPSLDFRPLLEELRKSLLGE